MRERGARGQQLAGDAKTLQEGGAARDGARLPRPPSSRRPAPGSPRRRFRPWGSSERRPTSPSGWRRSATASTRATPGFDHEKDAAYNAVDLGEATGGHEWRCTTAPSTWRPTARAPRPTRSCSRWAARTRTRGTRRTPPSSTSGTSPARRTSITGRRGSFSSRRRRSRAATTKAPTPRFRGGRGSPARRGRDLGAGKRQRRGLRSLHAGRRDSRAVREDPDPGRREAAQGPLEAEDRAAEGRREGAARLRIDGRRRMDDGQGLLRSATCTRPREVAASCRPPRSRARTRRRTTSRDRRVRGTHGRAEPSTPTRTAGKEANKLGIYNQVTAKMRDALGRLNSEFASAPRRPGFEEASRPPPMPAPHRRPEPGGLDHDRRRAGDPGVRDEQEVIGEKEVEEDPDGNQKLLSSPLVPSPIFPARVRRGGSCRGRL